MPKLLPNKNPSASTVGHKREKIYELSIYMAKETPFVNPGLTLEDLSQKIGIPSRELSELINGCLGTNFVSYVNSYRINMAKQLLTNPHETSLTISEIMYEVGFSSRSSFNTSFKKETGMTPSEFREGQINRSHNPKLIIQQLQ
nr:AraC family transcriptional regulator [uncultured Allomuricauda sp.]